MKENDSCKEERFILKETKSLGREERNVIDVVEKDGVNTLDEQWNFVNLSGGVDWNLH